MFETICRDCPFHRFSHTVKDAVEKGKFHKIFNPLHESVIKQDCGGFQVWTTEKVEESINGNNKSIY